MMIVMMIVYLTGRAGKGRSADQSAYWLPNGRKWWDAKGTRPFIKNISFYSYDDTFFECTLLHISNAYSSCSEVIKTKCKKNKIILLHYS